MKYNLIENARNDICSDIVTQILNNRGIQDIENYLNPDLDTASFDKLCNINEAVELFMKHIRNGSVISVLVDEDVDGFCSASMMIRYINTMDTEATVQYILHKKAKSHGLSDDVVVPENTELLIIPDAGTNDVEQCKKLEEMGIDILILDHHEKEFENPYAVIVNNQMSDDYANKAFCGAGIVYNFLQAVDEYTWGDEADNMIDLAALACIGDSMDMRSPVTGYVVREGLKNINSNIFKALISAQEFSMKGKVNIHNIQFYIAPVINGMVRAGSLEDKEILFRSFIDDYEEFDYYKRLSKTTIKESIYDRAARLSKNAKARQDKTKDKSVEEIYPIIKESFTDDTKVIVFDCTDYLHPSLTGLAAIKLANMFMRPCILLRKKENEDTYGGSARNINNSPIPNLKDVINSLNTTVDGLGHPNAFGIAGLSIDDFDKFNDELQTVLSDVEFDKTYNVDFIADITDIDTTFVVKASEVEDYIGEKIDEPSIVIKNISGTINNMKLYEKKTNTLSFERNGVSYVLYNCSDDSDFYNFMKNNDNENNKIVFEIVGVPSINDYKGLKIPQIRIKDYNILQNTVSNDEDLDDSEEDFSW